MAIQTNPPLQSQSVVSRAQLLTANFQMHNDVQRYLGDLEDELPRICSHIFHDPESTLQAFELLSNSNVEVQRKIEPYLLNTKLVYIKTQYIAGHITLQEAAARIVAQLEKIEDLSFSEGKDFIFCKIFSSLLSFDDLLVRKLTTNIIKRKWTGVHTWGDSVALENLEKELFLEQTIFEAIATHKGDENLQELYLEVVEKLLILPYLFNNPKKTLADYGTKHSFFSNGRNITTDEFTNKQIHFTLTSIFIKICQGYDRTTHLFLIHSNLILRDPLSTLNHLMHFYKHVIDDPSRVIAIGESFLSLTANFENSQNEPCIDYFHFVKTEVLGILGTAYDRQNQTKQAINCYLEGLSLSRQEDIGEAVATYSEILTHELKKIITLLSLPLPTHQIHDDLSLGLRIAQCLDSSEHLYILYSRFGTACADLGDYREAIRATEKSLELARSLQSPWRQAQSIGNLGIIYKMMGDYPLAEKHLLDQLKRMQELNDIRGQGRTYSALGSMAARLGQYSRAIEYHEKHISLIENYEQHTISSDVTERQDMFLFEEKWRSYNLLGDALREAGSYSRAIEAYLKVLNLSESNILFKREMEGAASYGIGCTYRKMAEEEVDSEKQKDYFLKAIEYSNKSLTSASSAHNPFLLSSAHTSLGHIFLRMQDFQSSVNHYLASLKIESSGEREEDKIKSYLNLANAYFSWNRFSEAKAYALQALEIWNSQYERLGKQDEWRITYFEKYSSIHRCLELILLSENTFETQREALLISEWRKSSVLNRALHRKIEQTEITPLSIPEIQALAAETKSTFLIYSTVPLASNEPGLAVWVVSPAGTIQYKRLSIQSIESDIEGLETLFAKFPFERKKNVDITIRPLQDLSSRGGVDFAQQLALSDFIKNNLAKWYRALIAPIEEYLPREADHTLTIVPDGFLAQFPFAAFQRADEKFLIENHPISIAPSIKTIQLLNNIQSQRQLGAPEDSLIIGNPSVLGLRNLSIGQKEARDIGRLLHVADSNMREGEAATVSFFLEKAPSARFILASCHGEAQCKPAFDPHSVFEGQLKLAPEEAYPTGNLHSQQISNMNLSAELVFLSACYSGAGKSMQEGTIGNVWSFLAAGALSTVATYWPLPETQTTRDMVNCFFEHLLGIGTPKLNKAQALQKAVLLGISKDRKRFNQWGAFYLSGLSY